MGRIFGVFIILSIVGFWTVAGMWTVLHGHRLTHFKFGRLPLWIKIYGKALVGTALMLVLYVMVDSTLAFIALT